MPHVQRTQQVDSLGRVDLSCHLQLSNPQWASALNCTARAYFIELQRGVSVTTGNTQSSDYFIKSSMGTVSSNPGQCLTLQNKCTWIREPPQRPTFKSLSKSFRTEDLKKIYINMVDKKMNYLP